VLAGVWLGALRPEGVVPRRSTWSIGADRLAALELSQDKSVVSHGLVDFPGPLRGHGSRSSLRTKVWRLEHRTLLSVFSTGLSAGSFRAAPRTRRVYHGAGRAKGVLLRGLVDHRRGCRLPRLFWIGVLQKSFLVVFVLESVVPTELPLWSVRPGRSNQTAPFLRRRSAGRRPSRWWCSSSREAQLLFSCAKRSGGWLGSFRLQTRFRRIGAAGGELKRSLRAVVSSARVAGESMRSGRLSRASLAAEAVVSKRRRTRPLKLTKPSVAALPRDFAA
jgi:hypothetical protein